MTSEVDAESIAEIVRNIWNSVLQMEVYPFDLSERSERTLGAMTASVQISGAWRGVVSAQFSPDFAKSSGATMLGLDAADLPTADLNDALGELANMIGGNVKALLPGPSALSLPWVTTGDGYCVDFPHCEVVQRVGMQAGGNSVVITVHRARSNG